jgi:CRISPR/Cas system-associated endoribonuclease Cas2
MPMQMNQQTHTCAHCGKTNLINVRSASHRKSSLHQMAIREKIDNLIAESEDLYIVSQSKLSKKKFVNYIDSYNSEDDDIDLDVFESNLTHVNLKKILMRLEQIINEYDEITKY